LPVPTEVKGLQRFLGLINFYRRFLPGIAATLLPLSDTLRGSPRHLTVTTEMTAAVAAAKDALAAATGLAHPLPHAQLALVTDTSDSHVGGVLQQREGAAWRPLSYFSQKLTPAQRRYSTFDRELTAVFSTLRHFRFMLEGRQFHVMTDHKLVVAAFGRVSPPWSARQQRQLAYITEYTTDIRHTPGASNAVADALSRPGPGSAPSPPPPQGAAPALHTTSAPSASPSAASSPTPAAAATLTTAQPFIAAIPDLAAFAAAQRTCPEVGLMRQSPSLDIVCRLVGTEYLFGDVSTPLFRPLVPMPFRRDIFDGLHNAWHPGVRATRRLISSHFVWPKMAQQVKEWARQCVACQRAKTTVHPQPPPATIPVPAHRFSHVNIDLVGPLPMSGGYTHLLTIIERSSRWPEAVPVSSTTAAACASITGSAALVYRLSSLRTVVCSSHPLCGHPCASCSKFAIFRRRPIILRRTVLLKDFIAASRTLCGPAALPQIGTTTCLGSSWLLGLLPVMRKLRRRLNCSMVPSWWFRASSSPLPRTHGRRTPSYSSSALLWTPRHRHHFYTIVPLPPQPRIRFRWPCFMPAMCLCAGTPPGRRQAAAGPSLRRPVPGFGALSPHLLAPAWRQDRCGRHCSPQSCCSAAGCAYRQTAPPWAACLRSGCFTHRSQCSCLLSYSSGPIGSAQACDLRPRRRRCS
jgi:RNase H-like domain found in reverse transcriptase/Integrase zinc binding domain